MVVVGVVVVLVVMLSLSYNDGPPFCTDQPGSLRRCSRSVSDSLGVRHVPTGHDQRPLIQQHLPNGMVEHLC